MTALDSLSFKSYQIITTSLSVTPLPCSVAVMWMEGSRFPTPSPPTSSATLWTAGAADCSLSWDSGWSSWPGERTLNKQGAWTSSQCYIMESWCYQLSLYRVAGQVGQGRGPRRNREHGLASQLSNSIMEWWQGVCKQRSRVYSVIREERENCSDKNILSYITLRMWHCGFQSGLMLIILLWSHDAVCVSHDFCGYFWLV